MNLIRGSSKGLGFRGHIFIQGVRGFATVLKAFVARAFWLWGAALLVMSFLGESGHTGASQSPSFQTSPQNGQFGPPDRPETPQHP